MSSARPIGVNFRILRDERGHPGGRCPGIKRKGGPLNDCEFSSI